MGRPDQYRNQWESREPQPPKQGSKLGFLVVGGLIAIFALAVCAGTAYYVLRPVLSQPEIAEPPAIPTLPGTAETAQSTQPTAAGSTPAESEATEPPVVEPTVPGAEPTTAGETPPTDTPASGEAPTVAPTATTAVSPGTAVAVSAPNAMTIDGAASDWPSTPSVRSPFQVYASGQWDNTTDLEVEWRLAWDSTSLYVFATVLDDTHVQTRTDTQIYRGDSLEIQIDTNPSAGARLVNPATYQLIFSPGNFADIPALAIRFRGAANGDIPEAPGHGIVLAARQTPDGYQLESAIPWRDLNVTPATGMRLGLALNANDNDTPGTAVQEVMMSNMPGRRLTDPSTWGTLLLQ